MAYISKITLPTGSTYDIKDAKAWSDIATLSGLIQGGVHYRGKTTTDLADGATTNPITIDGKDYTAEAGDMVSHANTTQGGETTEFIFNGSKWYEVGSTGKLKAFAYADKGEFSTSYTPQGSFSASCSTAVNSTGCFTPSGCVELTTTNKTVSCSYTPAGNISAPTFTGSAMTSTGTFTASGTVTTATTVDKTAEVTTGQGAATYTPCGSISTPTFCGNLTTFSGCYTPCGSVSISGCCVSLTVSVACGGCATYTPCGSVSAPTISVATAGTTATIHNPTANTVVTQVATVAACSESAAGELVYAAVGGDNDETLVLSKFTAATGASIGTDDVTVKTGDASYTASAPDFSGCGIRLATSMIRDVTSASFNGTSKSISVSGTPTGSVSAPEFTGTGVHLVTGKIAVPATYTFAGTEGQTVEVSGTPEGEVTAPTFTGTKATITGSVAVPTSAAFTGDKAAVEVSGTAAVSVSGNIVGTAATISAEVDPKTSV